MKNIALVLLCTLSFGSVHAQMKGIVYGSDKKDKKPLYGAKVRLLQAKSGTVTSEDGKFELILPKELPDTLVFSAMGYYGDTLIVDKADRFIAVEVVLYSDQLLPEVVVSHKKASHSISRLKVLQVEELTSGELRKAACCNLSESFETNVSVDVNITDAVSGAKKIQMMGLDGVYTQLQLENIPYLRGLESSFGLNSMPGTWVNSIQITKGTGNVVNGYESMAGLVNVELKKPLDMEALYFNLYANHMGRTELNFNSGFKLSNRWSTAWFAHASAHPMEVDVNKDNFRDMPNGTNAALLNRYHFQGTHMEAQLAINAYLDDKEGGQISSLRDDPNGFYDVQINTRHIDAFAKTGFFLKKPAQSIGIVYNAKYQETNALFGLRSFNGTEKRAYVNAIYDGYFGTTIHQIKTGLSAVYSDISQVLDYDSLSDSRMELVPGAFAEYTYNGLRISAVAGIRVDHHNIFGWQYSPRLHMKFLLSEYTDLRLTGGKGWRVPNYIIDNISLLASSDKWVEHSSTRPEISWNAGSSINHHFKLFRKDATLSIDYYHTYFVRQLVVDRDQEYQTIAFHYSDDGSFSNSLQSELAFSPSRGFDIRLAYKFLDVRAKYGDHVQQQVMIPKHRGFANFAFITRNKRWEYDLTITVYGKSRLHEVKLPDGNLSTDNQSDAFPILNAQITHVFKRWDFYVGAENLANYTQKNPIINAEDPFNDTFNATRIWAPIYGITIYGGIRFAIKQKKEENQ